MRNIFMKRRIEKAWRKRMEEYDKVKMLVYASYISKRFKEDALKLATIYAEYWMVQHYGTHWREKTMTNKRTV